MSGILGLVDNDRELGNDIGLAKCMICFTRERRGRRLRRMLWPEHNVSMSIQKSLGVMETMERRHVPVSVWSSSNFELALSALQFLKPSSSRPFAVFRHLILHTSHLIYASHIALPLHLPKPLNLDQHTVRSFFSPNPDQLFVKRSQFQNTFQPNLSFLQLLPARGCEQHLVSIRGHQALSLDHHVALNLIFGEHRVREVPASSRGRRTNEFPDPPRTSPYSQSF